MSERDGARLDCTHAAEGTLPEGKDVLAVASSTLRKYADWLEWLVFILYQLLPSRDV